MPCRYQQLTLRLLPAGAAVAGWVIFLPLEERVSTERSEFRLNDPKSENREGSLCPGAYRSDLRQPTEIINQNVDTDQQHPERK